MIPNLVALRAPSSCHAARGGVAGLGKAVVGRWGACGPTLSAVLGMWTMPPLSEIPLAKVLHLAADPAPNRLR